MTFLKLLMTNVQRATIQYSDKQRLEQEEMTDRMRMSVRSMRRAGGGNNWHLSEIHGKPDANATMYPATEEPGKHDINDVIRTSILHMV